MLVEVLLSHTIHVPFHLLLVIKCDNVSMIISVEIFQKIIRIRDIYLVSFIKLIKIV